MSKGIIKPLSPLLSRCYSIRNKIVGTLTLVAILILVYQIEILVVSYAGYQSPYAMFDSQPSQIKRILAASLGPFLHQGNSHLFGNLGALLLTGMYIEYFYKENTLYIFFLTTGYIAAWLPLLLGSVGTVGASGVTYGLQAFMAVHAIFRIHTMLWDVFDGEVVLDRRLGHIVPLAFGTENTLGVIILVLSGSISGAGDVSHFIGAMVGLVWGSHYVFNEVDSQPSITSLVK